MNISHRHLCGIQEWVKHIYNDISYDGASTQTERPLTHWDRIQGSLLRCSKCSNLELCDSYTGSCIQV